MRRRLFVICLGLSVIASLPLEAQSQRAAGTAAPNKGIWEPVNFSGDIDFNDVFFVNTDTGWVTGGHATLLKTTDGGSNWNVQLGGDPQSQEQEIRDLRFVDETTGWTTQRSGSRASLLHTTDGENWEQVGTIEYHYADYFFMSKTDGIFAHNDQLYRTSDSGARWTPVYTCAVRAEVDGLTRDLKCEVQRLHFPTPAVGFAFAYISGSLAAVLKTEDSGTTWNLAGLMENENARNSAVFFTDENNGVIRAYSGRSWVTSDGGKTWKGMIATNLGRNIRFADPEVGWSFAAPCIGMGCGNGQLSYTTDGGRRWTSRSFAFPAPVKAFSLPRRDQGFAVGDHGMIYRYRIVRATETVAKSIAAPAMPAFETVLDDQVEKLDAQLQSLEKFVKEPANGATATTTATAGGDVATNAGSELPPEITRQVNAAEATLANVATEAPQFVKKYKNLNLLLVALQMASELPAHLQGFKESFQALKKGGGLQTAAVVFPDLRMKSQNLVQMIHGFVQKH